VLAQHPAVREAAVVAPVGADGEKCLIGYAVLRDQMPTSAGDLRVWLREKLPAYMVPSSLIVLKRLPLTPNGKLDRHALPAPEESGEREEFVAPSTAVEELIGDIWSEVLRIPTVGIHDNFFDIGGHSIFATRVVSRISQILQVRLPLRKLFEFPTVAGLAGVMAADQRTEQRASEACRVKQMIKTMSPEERSKTLQKLRMQPDPRGDRQPVAQELVR